MHEQINTERKISPSQSRFINLMEMDQYEIDKFTDRVMSRDGLVRAFMHPYDIDNHSYKISFFPDYGIVERGLEKILSEGESSTPPVIIFEEKANTSLCDLNTSIFRKQNVYYIKTGEATPLLSKDNSEFYKKDDIKKLWNKVSDRFHALGIKKIIIGGYMMILVSPREGSASYNAEMEYTKKRMITGVSYAELVPGGCAGSAVVELSLRDFDIEISSFSYPQNRRSILTYEAHGTDSIKSSRAMGQKRDKMIY